MSEHTNSNDRLMRRLLGPSEPELTCEECFEHVDRYVELELAHGATRADEEIPGMRSHLEGCLACEEEHGSLLALVRADRRATHRD
jgi:hypothetical protein